jgi:DNA-binding NtrC family response regulator
VSAGTGLAVAARPDGLDSSERELIYRALLELRGDLREIKTLLGTAAAGGELRALPPHVPPAPLAPPPATPDGRVEEDYELMTPGEPHIPAPYAAADVDYEVEAEAMGPAEDLAGALRDGLALPTIEDAERTLIMEGLHRFDGNRRLTAEALGISERTLYRKIKELEDGDAES